MKLICLPLLLVLSGGALQQINAEIVPAEIKKVKEMIQVYPTPDNRGSLTVYSANDITLSFYLFDLEGKLIYQTSIKKNEKQTINGLVKGTYIYNAFQDDENIKGGKVILK